MLKRLLNQYSNGFFSHSSGPLNLLLVRFHQAEIITVKRLTQEQRGQDAI